MDWAEAEMFRKSLGCPCCYGVSPEKEDNREIEKLKLMYSSALQRIRSKPRITKLSEKDLFMEELGLSTLGDCEQHSWNSGLFSYKCEGCDDWDADENLLEKTLKKEGRICGVCRYWESRGEYE
jgi:hypothetical protein